MSSPFLLDTNVPSELARPLPHPRVAAWVAAQDNLYLSVVSVGELRKGFALLAPSRRRAELELWFDQFLPSVESRILPITESVASRWGLLSAERQLTGMPLSMADGLIAATALEHGLTVVTRNVSDFAGLRLTIFNPWND